MAQYDISVIIPVYNAGKYIRQCIESVINQTKDDIEIVIVNDGSTDDTASIINSFAEKYYNVFAFNQENQGVAIARVFGLRNSHGKYIGWVDSDDFVEPEMFEKLFNLAETEKADYVYCDYDFFPKKVEVKDKWFKEYKGVRDADFIDRNTQCWNTLVTKELYDRVNIENLLIEYSEYSWIAAMLMANKIAYTKECLYHYRVGHTSLSGGSYLGKVAHFRKGAERSSRLKIILKDTGYEEKLSDYMDYRYIYTLLQLEIVAAVNSDRMTYGDAAKELKRMNFKKNPYTKIILDSNHGIIKSFVIRNVITANYQVAHLITDIIF